MKRQETTLDQIPIIDNTLYFCDTETIGLYGQVRLFQVIPLSGEAVLYVQWPNPIQLIKWHNAIIAAGSKVVYQNSHYDLTTMQQQGHRKWIPPYGSVIDTLLLGRLAIPQLESHSLDSLMTHVLKYDPYKSFGLNKKEMQGSDWSKPMLTEDQLNYACIDVWHLPAVYNAVKSELESESYNLDMLMLHYCLDFQWVGMPVDEDRLMNLYQRKQAEIAALPMPINVNSYQQVRKYIGQEESDDLALARFAQEGCPKSANIRKLKKAKKLVSFLEKFTDLSELGRIFGKFKPAAKSGRATSDDQNLQQLPRASKEVFGTKGLMLYADYAQLELRTICAISRDKTMEQLFREGKDLHTYTSDVLLGTEEELMSKGYEGAELKAIRKRNRQVTKTANFCLLYGGGIGMFIDILLKTTDIWLDGTEAGIIKRRWLNLFQGVNAWQQKGISAFSRGKLGCTPLGRKYKANMMTDQLNIENQGAGAEVAKLAMHYLHKAGFKEKHPEWQICNFIHDSFILENPNPVHDLVEAREVAEMLAEAMQKAWFAVCQDLAIKDLPMPVTVSCGQNWGDIENDDIPNLFDYELDGMHYYGQ